MNLDAQIKLLEKEKLALEVKNAELSGEVTIAQKEKLISETRKVEVEKDKLQFEHEEAKKENSKKWWLRKNFRNQLIAVLIGSTFLGFYIVFVIIPASNLENIQLKIDNKKVERQNYESQLMLSEDSVLLVTQMRRTDSLSSLLTTALRDKHKLDSSYKAFVKKSEEFVTSTKSGNNTKVILDNITTALKEINKLNAKLKVDTAAVNNYKQNTILYPFAILDDAKHLFTGSELQTVLIIINEPLNPNLDIKNATLSVFKRIYKDEVEGTRFSYHITNGAGYISLPPGRYILQAAVGANLSQKINITIGPVKDEAIELSFSFDSPALPTM
jgi:hypothetical protein